MKATNATNLVCTLHHGYNGLLPKDTKLRSSKYLNNLIEQDHRNIKSRVNVMLGFKRFKNSAITIAGIELHAPNPQGTVQPRGASQRGHCAGCLERSPVGLISRPNFDVALRYVQAASKVYAG